jgi:sigma-B regulation protein RsbU (phosphoserine phosphatase)
LANSGGEVSRSFLCEGKRDLSLVYDFISETVLAAGGGDEDISSLKLIADEIFTNVTNYAYEEGEPRFLRVGVSVENGSAILTFADRGKPFDPTAAPSPDVELSADERDFGGLGIHMVRFLADEMSYERTENENILTVKKRLKG